MIIIPNNSNYYANLSKMVVLHSFVAKTLRIVWNNNTILLLNLRIFSNDNEHWSLHRKSTYPVLGLSPPILSDSVILQFSDIAIK